MKTDDDQQDRDGDEDEQRDPEEQTVNDQSQRSPVFGVIRLVLKRLLTTRYLPQTKSVSSQYIMQFTVTIVERFNVSVNSI